MTKSIKSKLLFRILAMVVASVLVLGTIGTVLNYFSAVNTLETTITETAEVASGQIKSTLMQYRMLVKDLGMNAQLSNDIADVVHDNAASAEESAAAGAELSNQSKELRALTEQFKLKSSSAKEDKIQAEFAPTEKESSEAKTADECADKTAAETDKYDI